MHLNPDEWQLILANPAVNWQGHDHSAIVLHHDETPTLDRPIIIVDAVHIQTGFSTQLAIHMSPSVITLLTASLIELRDSLVERGSIDG